MKRKCAAEATDDQRDTVSRGIPVPASGSKFLVQFYEFTTSSIRTVTELGKPIRHSLNVSPDGSYLLFTQYDNFDSDVMMIENFR